MVAKIGRYFYVVDGKCFAVTVSRNIACKRLTVIFAHSLYDTIRATPNINRAIGFVFYKPCVVGVIMRHDYGIVLRLQHRFLYRSARRRRPKWETARAAHYI